VAVFLNGRGIPDRNPLGERVSDDSFLLLINGHYEDITFILPGREYGADWTTVLDTADPEVAARRSAQPTFAPGDKVAIPARALRLLQAAEG
jgi:glycogen operon protein